MKQVKNISHTKMDHLNLEGHNCWMPFDPLLPLLLTFLFSEMKNTEAGIVPFAVM